MGKGELALYGWLVSPYTAKVRSYLWHRKIPFRDITPSAAELFFTVKPAVGRIIMPTVKKSDGSWLQDSQLICDMLDVSFPGSKDHPSVVPPGPAQRLASDLLELHGDEWLPLLGLYYRWFANGAANAPWAVEEFARMGFPWWWFPTSAAKIGVGQFASKMQSFGRVQGISATDGTFHGLDAFSSSLIGHLDSHFGASRHDFLLGGVPSRGDFSMYGVLWSHLFRDPESRALYDSAPHVVRWMERLHGHAEDPTFRALPTARATSCNGNAARVDGCADFLDGDHVPASLDPIFATLFAEQWEFLRVLSKTIDDHMALRSATPTAAAPRAFGYAPFQVGGAAGSRRLVTYQAWRMQRCVDTYEEFTDAERESADAWLRRIGAFEAFRSLKPRFRLHRDCALPLAQESFSTTNW